MALASAIGENAALSGGLAASMLYLGLHTATPGTTGASEVTGGSPAYARVASSWATASGGSMSNSGSQTVNVPASTTVSYASQWNTSTISGTTGYVIGDALTSSVSFGATQGTVSFAVGANTFSAS